MSRHLSLIFRRKSRSKLVWVALQVFAVLLVIVSLESIYLWGCWQFDVTVR
ncbi:hypothetical protein PAN31117_04665 [Pandoraea anapnoica]|uniref:Uncharacterized protein n=1 Tax=Pandoraea anapnoica TaxID=2508301 RepID=A0A5E5AHP0_9BURK|nr:hypothetical protein PIN31009_04216 [Pandoraea iniqua]VVE73231.1 hypothetical protein PAN31117_04665 [Pandoraea anapnoica]